MTTFEIDEVQSQHAAVVRGHVRGDELSDFFGRAFGVVYEALIAQGIEAAGPPVAYYPAMPDEVFDVEAGFPTAGAVEPVGDVVPLVLPHGRVARGVHIGPYDTLTETYDELFAWLAEQGESPGEQMWRATSAIRRPNRILLRGEPRSSGCSTPPPDRPPATVT